MGNERDRGSGSHPREVALSVALFPAASSNDVSNIRFFVRQGADPNAISEHGHTPLHNACITNSVAAIAALLDLGADPNQRYDYRSPIGRRNERRVERSLTAIMYALSPEAVQTLLEYGANPHAMDARGFNPLILASLRGHSQVVKALLDAGVDPGLKVKLKKRAVAKTARELSEEMLAFWRSLPPCQRIAGRIKEHERVKNLLAAAEANAARP